MNSYFIQSSISLLLLLIRVPPISACPARTETSAAQLRTSTFVTATLRCLESPVCCAFRCPTSRSWLSSQPSPPHSACVRSRLKPGEET
eukprot:6194167-Pleurochrysis_carterae.AAC.1